MDDLRLALRRLSKRPAATIASIVTLAFSIGAGAATWSLLSALLLNPLPVRDPESLVVPGVTGLRKDGLPSDSFIYPFYPQLRDSGIFERVAAMWSPAMNLLVGSDDDRAPAAVVFASHDFFQVLGVPVVVGRDFQPHDDQRGASGVAILTDSYWRRQFSRSPDVIGQTITVAGKPATIIGIAKRGFRGLDLAQPADLYLPFHTIADYGSPFINYFADPTQKTSPTAGMRMVARVRANEPVDTLQARLANLPRVNVRTGVFVVTPLETTAVAVGARESMRQFAQLLAATVAMLILIGCLTVGMLLLVRTEARREEFAMCRALGASRIRLARGIGIEGALLAAAGAIASIPVASWMFRGVGAFQMPGGITIDLLDMSIDARALAIVAATAVMATLVVTMIAGAFGLASDKGDVLRARAGATPTVTRRRTRAVLVASQVSVALVLVTSAVLFGRSLQAALSLNPGFATSRIVNVPLSLRQYQYTPPRAQTFFNDLSTRLIGNPSISSVSLTASQLSIVGKLVIDGVPRTVPSTAFTLVDHAYFGTLGLRIVEGRAFSERDVAQAPLVGIASASFARFVRDGAGPIGSRITMPFSRPPAPPPVVEIVGVVPDVITSVTALEPYVLYLPITQAANPIVDATVTLRAASDANAAKREALSAIKQIDRSITPGPMLTIDERLTRQMGPQQFGAVVLGALGVIAVLLTLLGTFVLAESMAVLRMREMGVRAALGASGRQLASIVLAETGRLVGIGLLLGVGLVWWGASAIRSLLFRMQPLDVATLASVAGLILVLSVIVTLRPALRAARVDLNRVLREP